MIRLGQRASLLVAFSLLTSAATAYAACAWVLWVEETGRKIYARSTSGSRPGPIITTFAPAAGPVATARRDVDLQRQPRAHFVTPILETFTNVEGAALIIEGYRRPRL